MAEEKKIIIDEDWKAQVQAEKEAATKNKAATSGEAEAPQRPVPEDVPLPPASFEGLLTMLATEAFLALGHVPHPVTGKATVHRHQAKYVIDLIEVLREKTRGNLTEAEQQLMENLLHQLRLTFVEAASATTPAQNN